MNFSDYKMIKRDGHFGDDFNHDIEVGKMFIPLHFETGIEFEVVYAPVNVLYIDNSGRLQVIVVKDEHDCVFVLSYNGATNWYEFNYDELFDDFLEYAGVKDKSKFYDLLGAETINEIDGGLER